MLLNLSELKVYLTLCAALIFLFSVVLPIHVDEVLQDVPERFQRLVECSVSVPSHHIVPSGGLPSLLNDMIGGIFLGSTYIIVALTRLVVAFSMDSIGSFRK